MAIVSHRTSAVRLLDISLDPTVDGQMTRNGNDIKVRSNGLVYNLSRLPIVALKTADQTVNNSTTLVDDNHLFIPMGANETWHFQGSLEISGSVPADHKMAMAIPAGCTGLWTSTISNNHITDVPLLTTVVVFPTLGVTIRMHRQFFCKVVNGGTAGDFQVQWAQNGLDVSDLTVYSGSSLIGWRLA